MPGHLEILARPTRKKKWLGNPACDSECASVRLAANPKKGKKKQELALVEPFKPIISGSLYLPTQGTNHAGDNHEEVISTKQETRCFLATKETGE